MFDIITIGSATCDVFVDTKDRLFQGDKCVKVPFGSKILIDQIHTDIGGGSVNTGIAFSRLGLKTAVLTKIGKDDFSRSIIRGLKIENINTNLIIQDSRVKTDYSVILDTKGRDRTILVYKNASKKLSWGEINQQDIKTRWFYFGTMLGKSYETLLKIAEYAQKNKIKIALNISQYLAKKRPLELIEKVDVLIVNKQEAELLASSKLPINIKDLLMALHGIGSKIVVITDKDNDIKAYDGNKVYSVSPHKEIKVVERTGAGDAFASSFVSGIIKGKDIDFSLNMALINSESVITHYGARNKLLKWDELIIKIKNKKYE